MCLTFPEGIVWKAETIVRSEMFGRAAFIKVKPGCEGKLTNSIEHELVPTLRREKSFRGLFALILPGGNKALSLSLWDHEENAAESYAKTFGALTGWREWSWRIGWFKSGKSRNPISAP